MPVLFARHARSRPVPVLLLAGIGYLAGAFGIAVAFLVTPAQWRREWPRTDFTKHAARLKLCAGAWNVLPGGLGKDGIPAIDRPTFAPAGGEARAYPLRTLIRHEIVNGVVGGPAASYLQGRCEEARPRRRRCRTSGDSNGGWVSRRRARKR